MKIDLDGTAYDVPAEYRNVLITQMWAMVMQEYEKISDGMKIPAMMLTRKLLYDIEKSLTKTHGKEIAVQIARPPKGGDPNIHLLWIMSAAIREGLSNAIISISTTPATHTIDAFAVSIPRESEGGGSLVADGDIRQRENHSGEIA